MCHYDTSLLSYMLIPQKMYDTDVEYVKSLYSA